PFPVDAKFAADPRVVHIPGMAIHGFIGGFRGQDSGIIAVQHWLENNKEDFDRYEPGRESIVVDVGTEGRFIDKPEFLGVLASGSPQPTITLSTIMENPALGTIARDYPAGKLFAAYAVFTGSQSVKLLVKKSDNWGQTWPNQSIKLTESQNLVSGISMTAKGGTIMAMWRQALDTNDSDALYYATTTNEGQSWSKPKLLTNICKFDQPTATVTTPPQVMFRTNNFPWLANDGKRIYAFYAVRTGDCLTGTPKVVMMHTTNGNSWSAAIPLDASAEAAPGAQFMPAAFGANGKVQVAWYDTRRELVPIVPTQPFVADYVPAAGVRINRIIDVYTARVTSDASGNNVQVSPSARVSQYRTIADISDPLGPKYEIEASFGNAMMYKTGLLAFMGDYIAVAGQEYRPTATGGWESNSSPLPSPASNLTNFFIAYADHRDVRGDVLLGDGGANPSGYTPPDNVAPTTETAIPKLNNTDEPMLADNVEAGAEAKTERQSTEGLEDTFTDPGLACIFDQDRTRDANIYGSVIRDQLRLSTPSARPLSGILRAFPISATNVSPDPKAYRLFIATQPGADALLHRASFRQKPDRAPFVGAPPPLRVENVSIEPNSSVARTVFVVSPNRAATVDVQIFDGVCAANADPDNTTSNPFAFASACPVLADITLGGTGTAGTLQQPDYQSTACSNDPLCVDNVDLAELHNPRLENPLLENPLLENPLLENPRLENMELEAPRLENPLLENPLLENFGFENPLLENPLLENPLLENPLLENPRLENPRLENPRLENSALEDGVTYMDITAAVTNDGNVTTAFNFDVTASGLTTTAGDPEVVSQLILWKQYVYGTSRDCLYLPEVRNQVLTTINQPDNMLEVASIEEPFDGEASMLLAPGETGYVTYRVFGTLDELAPVTVDGFTASSQAANCREFDSVVGPPPGQEDNFYLCESQLADDRERVLIQRDASGPTFDGLADGDVIPAPPIEADRPGGACVDLVGSRLVSATDASTFEILCSLVSTGTPICTASDPAGGLSIPVQTLVSPDPAAVSCTATDEFGNSTTLQLGIAVEDSTAPTFTSLPMNPTVLYADPITGTTSPVLENGLAATDVVDPSPVIACVSSPGGQVSRDPLPAGFHDIDCSATDASGNAATFSYMIQVIDQTAPVFSGVPANITAPATSASGAVVTYALPTATDNSGTAPTVTCIPPSGSTFPFGITTVSCTATDVSGNSSQATFQVTVTDSIAPVITVPAGDVSVQIQSAAGAVYDYSSLVSISDNVDPQPVLSCVPASGSTFAPGDTTVTCTGTDASSNSSTATFTISVGYAGSTGITPTKM
ncbi:MAG: HYR domain-containing protein, partial [Woeseiaceae bacterium]|nr:HYR domain-containing protein [Woeseiaceae bacterium]